jgi:hypothetical protein
MNGEQKSVTQKQCYYSVVDKLNKIETGGSKAAKAQGELRGKVAANKKEELSDYMKSAIAKIQTYLPPEPEKIQKIYNAGKYRYRYWNPIKNSNSVSLITMRRGYSFVINR